MKRVSCWCPVIKVSAARSNPSKFQWSSRQSFSGCNRGKLQFLQKRQKIVCLSWRPVVGVSSGQLGTHSINHSHTPSLFTAALWICYLPICDLFVTLSRLDHRYCFAFSQGDLQGFRCNKGPCKVMCMSLKSLGGVVSEWVGGCLVSLLGPMLPAHWTTASAAQPGPPPSLRRMCNFLEYHNPPPKKKKKKEKKKKRLYPDWYW